MVNLIHMKPVVCVCTQICQNSSNVSPSYIIMGRIVTMNPVIMVSTHINNCPFGTLQYQLQGKFLTDVQIDVQLEV